MLQKKPLKNKFSVKILQNIFVFFIFLMSFLNKFHEFLLSIHLTLFFQLHIHLFSFFCIPRNTSYLIVTHLSLAHTNASHVTYNMLYHNIWYIIDVARKRSCRLIKSNNYRFLKII